MTDINFEDYPCKVCRAPSAFCCDRCRELYCSVSCQEEDWRDHKYICISMPRLKKLVRPGNEQRAANQRAGGNPKPPKPLNTKMNEFQRSTAKSLSNKWQQSMEPPFGKFFDVIVQSIGKPPMHITWVLGVDLQDSLRKFMQYTNEMFTTKIAVMPDTLLVKGDLVVAKYENNYCRASVESLYSEMENVIELRLIDFGNTIYMKTTELLMPSQFMSEEKSYAMGIRLEQPLGKEFLKKTITIRIDDNNKLTGCYMATMMAESYPKYLPIDHLIKRGNVELTKLFAYKQYALLKTPDSFELTTNLTACLDKDDTYTFATPPAVGDFVAAYVNKLWVRARLLTNNTEDKSYLIYDLDNGVVNKCSQIKEIPLPYRQKPISVFGIVSAVPLYELHTIAACKPLSLKLPEGMQNIYSTNVQASLYAAHEMLCNVVCKVFTGLPEELNMSYFAMEIGVDSQVYITHVVSSNRFYINRCSCKSNNDLFNKIAADSARVGKLSKLRPGEIVLYENDKGNYQRGEITSISLSLQEITIFNIDTGATDTVVLWQLAKANDYLRCRPVYLHKVKYDGLNARTNTQAALELLQQHHKSGTEFILKLDERKEIVLCAADVPHKPIISRKLLEAAGTQAKPVFSAQQTPRKLSHANSADSLTEVCTKFVETLAPRKHFDEPIRKTPIPTNSNNSAESNIGMTAHTAKSQTNNLAHTSKEPIVKAPCRKLFKTFTYADLKVEPLIEGDNVKLLALDVGSLEQGFISAANARDRGLIKQILNEHQETVLKYANDMRSTCASYKPKVNEMCLVIDFKTEKWYRGWCMAELSEKEYHLMNIDIGNMSKEQIDNIFPITEELMFPCLANMVYIEEISDAIAKPFAEAIKANDNLIWGKVNKVADDAYMLKVKDIRGYMANC